MSQSQYTRAVTLATGLQLISFYNEHSIKSVKKFADRNTAEKRVLRLIQDMINNATNPRGEEQRILEALSGFPTSVAATPDYSSAAVAARVAADKFQDGEFGRLEGLEPEVEDDGTVSGFSVHGLINCPSCGIPLSNGVGEHNQEVNGKLVKHTHFEFECLACGEEFGPALPTVKKVTANKVGPRPAMAQSLKIDRRIVDLLTGEEYANACQVWKAGLVSAAQGDRLSAVLYGAFKTTGKRDATVAINGHTFRLAF